MNATTDDAATNLLELAKASWNADLLVPFRPELMATRPLMILWQQIHDQPITTDIGDIRRPVQEQLAHTASLSHFIEAHDGVSALFLIEFDVCDSTLAVAMVVGEGNDLRAAPDLLEALRLEVPWETEVGSEDAGEPYRSQHLWTIIVLPESSAQHIDLESIQEAIPDFTGRAYWFDASDELVKVQGWDDGEMDTGYLWAIREDEDVEPYTYDAAPRRALFAKLASAAARSR